MQMKTVGKSPKIKKSKRSLSEMLVLKKPVFMRSPNKFS